MRTPCCGIILLVVFLGTLLLASPLVAQPAQQAFGFNGTVSGFRTGVVFVSGGGAYALPDFVHSAGGFSCLEDVEQGPLSMSINPDDLGPCLTGEGVRWDTAELLTDTISFKCTGDPTEPGKQAKTSDTTVVLQADFYRAGDGIDESFTAQMIVSATDIAPSDFPGANLWVQGVGCGTAIVHFAHKP